MNVVVTSQKNPLAYAKAIATLVGTIATALLGVYASDTEVGKVLTIISIIATAVATWAVPNATVVPDDLPDSGLIEDGETYEDAGGQPYPSLYGQTEPLYQPGSDESGFGGDAPEPQYGGEPGGADRP